MASIYAKLNKETAPCGAVLKGITPASLAGGRDFLDKASNRTEHEHKFELQILS